MVFDLDIDALVAGLTVIESIAIIPRVTSTHDLARRVVTECLDDELPPPSASLIALEQSSGRGRGARSWSSPPGSGIYATTIHTIPQAELALYPLHVGNVVATFLREEYGIAAGLKWPNDILAGGRKIAGVLLEARTQEGLSHVLISVGINVVALGERAPVNATSIAETTTRVVPTLAGAIGAFVVFLDRQLGSTLETDRILPLWRKMTIHRDGDRVTSIIADRAIDGVWRGIDDRGRALIESGGEIVKVSAGDVIIQ